MPFALCGQIMGLYEWYLNTFEFDKMTDSDLENLDKVCDVLTNACRLFIDGKLSTCDDLRKYIIATREAIGIPMSETEKIMLTNATEQTDAFIQDIDSYTDTDNIELSIFMSEPVQIDAE